jgi:hypothetical protein
MLGINRRVLGGVIAILLASPAFSQKSGDNQDDGQNGDGNPSSQKGAAPLNTGTIGWWPLDEAAHSHAVYDYANSFTGSVFGVTLGQPGEVSTAATFDGVRDYISLGVGPAITGTGSFTVDAWIRTSDTRGVIIQQRQSTGYDGEYMLSVGGPADGAFAMSAGFVCWTTFGDGLFGFNFCSNRYISDGRWHHVAATRETNGTGKIYIDGALAGSQAAPPRHLQPFNVFLGADKRDCAADDPASCITFNASQLYLKGSLDEVQIVNRALTAQEVSNIYNAGAAGFTNVVMAGASKIFDSESHGNLAVTLCSSASFDPRTLDPLSITMAGAALAVNPNGTRMFSYQQVSSCGADKTFPDMVLQFDTDTLQVSSNDTVAFLRGATKSSVVPTKRIRASAIVKSGTGD